MQNLNTVSFLLIDPLIRLKAIRPDRSARPQQLFYIIAGQCIPFPPPAKRPHRRRKPFSSHLQILTRISHAFVI
jgi:hypothetical protein